jgi:hypothetical protein
MEATERDMLISRIIDGRATSTDWRLLDAEGTHDPSVWRELAHAQRDHQALCAAMDRASSIADAVELPPDSAANYRFPGVAGGVRAWAGWAAAAAILIVATSRGVFSPSVEPVVGGNQAGLLSGIGTASADTAAAAWDRYMDVGAREGRVVRELPDKVMVETRPATDGTGYDVYFVRQILERVRVADLYTGVTDEAGNSRPMRVRVRSQLQGAM